MGTDPDELEGSLVWFPVDKDQIWLDMTISMIGPAPNQRVVKIPISQ
jgi:hypothetical protein